MKLIVSPNEVLENTPLDRNLCGDFLAVSIKEAQELDLEEVVGSEVMEELYDGGESELMEKVKPFLYYATMSRVMPKVMFKIANAGVVMTGDTNLSGVGYDTLVLLRQEAINIRDVYKKRLQDWLRKNKCSCVEDGVRQHLESSAECPIWLGGKRGR